MSAIDEFLTGIDKTVAHLSQTIRDTTLETHRRELDEQRTNLYRLRLFLSTLVTLLEETQ